MLQIIKLKIEFSLHMLYKIHISMYQIPLNNLFSAPVNNNEIDIN